MLKLMIFAFFCLSLFACSKGGGGGGGTIPPVTVDSFVKDGAYLYSEEDMSVPFSSKKTTAAVIENGILMYNYGVINNYSVDKEGNQREGSHPDAEFKTIKAEFKIEKSEDNKIKLVFIESSCGNPQTNPFPDLSLSPIEFNQDEEYLSFKLNTTTAEALLSVSKEDFVKAFKSIQVTEVFCPGEDV